MPAAEVTMAAGVGGAAGGVSAVTVVFAIARRRLRLVRSMTVDDDDFDEFPEEQAREAARQWSERAGEPEAERLITEKLRVGWEVQQRRARRARR